MKSLHWVCLLSGTANLAFLGYAVSHSSTLASANAHPAAVATPAVPASINVAGTGGGAGSFVRADTPLAKLLDGTDLPSLRVALEATGLTLDECKAIMRNRIRGQQGPARDAIKNRRNPQDDCWWVRDDAARNKFEEQRAKDRQVLDNDVKQRLATLFGPEPSAPASPRIHSQAEFLPEAKRLAVSQILRDYDEMAQGTRGNYRGMELASDAEKRRFIDEERRKDLTAILTPEELRTYDLRNSSTANQLRWSMGTMKPSLAEYEAIYDSMESVNRKYDNRTEGDRPPDFWQKRQEAEKASLAVLRKQLGQDRFIDYALSSDHNASQVNTAVERYALPQETARNLWILRQEVGSAGKAIFEDRKLSEDEKFARIAQLAASSRQNLDRILSATVQAELKQNDFVKWVGDLERNQIRVYNETGNGSSGFTLHRTMTTGNVFD
jgi:hypothetical protein